MRNLRASGTSVLAWLLLSSFGPSLAQADFVTYQVSVDTSGITGQAGNLDFQFNPGDSSAEVATASVTNFQTVGGILSQPAALTGDAVGSLPGTLTLDNGTAYNDAFQGFTYGNTFSFLLTLSGQAIDSPGGTFGSSFALSLYDASGITPLLTTDPNGSVLTVNLNADGTTSAETFPQSLTNSTSIVIANQSNMVPEPSSYLLFIIALLLIVLIRLLTTLSALGSKVQKDSENHFPSVSNRLPNRISQCPK